MSKELGRIRTEVKKRMRDLVADDLWEYGKNMSGQDAAIKKQWEIAEDKSASARSRVQALALILEFYDTGQGDASGVKGLQGYQQRQGRGDLWEIK